MSVADQPDSPRERAVATVSDGCIPLQSFYAAERTRTSKPVRARRPERRVFANFTTAAGAAELSNCIIGRGADRHRTYVRNCTGRNGGPAEWTFSACQRTRI